MIGENEKGKRRFSHHDMYRRQDCSAARCNSRRSSRGLPARCLFFKSMSACSATLRRPLTVNGPSLSCPAPAPDPVLAPDRLDAALLCEGWAVEMKDKTWSHRVKEEEEEEDEVRSPSRMQDKTCNIKQKEQE